MHGPFRDFRHAPDVVQDAVRDLSQWICDRDNAMLHPSWMDQVSIRVGVRDADWDDGGVGFLLVIKVNEDNAHSALPDETFALSVTAAVFGGLQGVGAIPCLGRNISQPEKNAMATSIFSHNDQYSRLESKLRRELGESIMKLL